MLRKLNRLRKERPGIISAQDLVHIVTSSMLIPREEHNGLLAELSAKIEGIEKPEDRRIRVVAAGHPCAVPVEGLLGLIEEGMVIVDDDFFSGGRYFARDVDPDGDPIEAFADYYLAAVPCTTYHFPANWVGGGESYSPYADYIVDMAKSSQAGGVVLVREMYCDPFDMEYVLMKKRLEEEDISYLTLFTEHGLGPLEPVRTRLQAFTETLKRG